ncbi:DUF3626 domain-containing protein [Frankia sp. QA3]|uniref:DUF3626 domain-containing protein n=1 Tax=Frankia sp. QA3 TaxID=710111 RepID=UPI000269C115|nr:DUF3626 domain-containing protein [Frankia sp. QA3]EIV92550.1 Protein of unknown function (DUF3626) [Frankia sp. QA3]
MTSPPQPRFDLEAEIDWNTWQPGSATGATMARNLALLIAQAVGLEPDWPRRATARGSLLASIEDRKLDVLAAAVVDAVARGDSTRALERTLLEVLDRTTWADLVATTEMNRAMTAAALDTYQQQGVPAREFVISPVDTIIGPGGKITQTDRVCPRCHRNADAGAIPLSAEFPKGDPPVHPACRCTVVPSWPEIAKAFNPRQVRGPDGRWVDMPGGDSHRDEAVGKPRPTSPRGSAPFWHPAPSFWDDPRVQAVRRTLERPPVDDPDDIDDMEFDPDDEAAFEFQGDHPLDYARVVQYVAIDNTTEAARQESRPHLTSDQFRAEMQAYVEQLFAGEEVAVRVTGATLQSILEEGRLKNQHETGTSLGALAPAMRSQFEDQWFGTTPSESTLAQRPVYGYLMVDGERAAGSVHQDALSGYDRLQIVMRPEIVGRTTAMVGDSLDHVDYGLPSPLAAPVWQSASPGLLPPDRDYSDSGFREQTYVEAQIHGGVHLDDIDRVILPSDPTANLAGRLQELGISWTVRRGDS